MAVLDEEFFKRLKQFLLDIWEFVKQMSIWGAVLLVILFILILIQQIILSLFPHP